MHPQTLDYVTTTSTSTAPASTMTITSQATTTSTVKTTTTVLSGTTVLAQVTVTAVSLAIHSSCRPYPDHVSANSDQDPYEVHRRHINGSNDHQASNDYHYGPHGTSSINNHLLRKGWQDVAGLGQASVPLNICL